MRKELSKSMKLLPKIPMPPLLPADKGTFSFCSVCPTKECCIFKTPRGDIATPILFSREVEAIKIHTKKKISSFSLQNKKRNELYNLKEKAGGGCLFQKKGGCSIYPVRPLDCRLYPLDLYWEPFDSRMYLIGYADRCPVETDLFPLVERAAKLIASIPAHEPEWEKFGQDNTKTMDQKPYYEFGFVEKLKNGRLKLKLRKLYSERGFVKGKWTVKYRHWPKDKIQYRI